ncbi:MAG: single-stranded-DNA-specific exonuclease RecJ [Clostridiales bacterium]|nr:single-stranded-DNA-specific exonuclease RecJ [Clostridiales bacterium]
MKYEVWKINKKKTEIPESLLKAGYTKLSAAVLAAKGIRTPEKAGTFLCSGAEMLTDPMQMPGMAAAVGRIKKAIEEGEKIAVYGDYDVDGISSTALLLRYFRSVGADCIAHIPDRLEEGYGLNSSALFDLHNSGVSLVITVDCGITAIEEVDYANSLGLDIIITDHHECVETALPSAVAIVNPKLPGNPEELDILAGVGVAFKLVSALSGDAEEMLKSYADLIALGTIADVMPLVGENKYISKRGLKMLEKSPNLGINRLIAKTAPNKAISSMLVGYSIGPRINAAGRLGRADLALELFVSENPQRAEELVDLLEEMNLERQEIEKDILDDIDSSLDLKKIKLPLVLHSEDWHPGIVGITAAKLADRHAVPCIIICFEGDLGKGSCRSFGGYNIYEGLSYAKEYLEGFGGHAFAAGISIKRENIEPFKKKLSEHYLSAPKTAKATISADLIVDDPELLSYESVASLEDFEPWGSGNEKPILYLPRAKLRKLSSIGGGRHCKLILEKGNKKFSCVMFSAKAVELGVREGELCDTVMSPQINEYLGRKQVQLNIADIRRSCEREFFRDVLSGEFISDWDASEVCPERQDFVSMWRYITRAGGSVEAKLNELDKESFGVKKMGTAAFCLKVLKDSELLEMKHDEEKIEINLKDFEEKVDLMSHPMLSRSIGLRARLL